MASCSKRLSCCDHHHPFLSDGGCAPRSRAINQIKPPLHGCKRNTHHATMDRSDSRRFHHHNVSHNSSCICKHHRSLYHQTTVSTTSASGSSPYLTSNMSTSASSSSSRAKPIWHTRTMAWRALTIATSTCRSSNSSSRRGVRLAHSAQGQHVYKLSRLVTCACDRTAGSLGGSSSSSNSRRSSISKCSSSSSIPCCIMGQPLPQPSMVMMIQVQQRTMPAQCQSTHGPHRPTLVCLIRRQQWQHQAAGTAQNISGSMPPFRHLQHWVNSNAGSNTAANGVGRSCKGSYYSIKHTWKAAATAVAW